ncbi:MAG: hypothetical protein NWR47_09390, partial [Aestuariivirgaceae bacterium]|nr:hypothetical protein [Aestuariivirgaceae bacterium]
MGYNIDGTKTVYDWYTKNSPPADSTTFKSSIEQLMNRNIGYNKKQWTEFEDTTGATVKKSGRGETFTFKNTERTEWTNHESGLIFRMTENAGGNFNGNGTWIKLT